MSRKPWAESVKTDRRSTGPGLSTTTQVGTGNDTRDEAASGDMKSGDLQVTVRLNVTVHLLMQGLEGSAKIFRAEMGRGYPDRPLLPPVPETHTPVGRDPAFAETLRGEDSKDLFLEFAVESLDNLAFDPVEIADQDTRVIASDIGVEHAQGAERARLARDVDCAAPEKAGDGRAMHRSGSARGNQN